MEAEAFFSPALVSSDVHTIKARHCCEVRPKLTESNMAELQGRNAMELGGWGRLLESKERQYGEAKGMEGKSQASLHYLLKEERGRKSKVVTEDLSIRTRSAEPRLCTSRDCTKQLTIPGQTMPRRAVLELSHLGTNAP